MFDLVFKIRPSSVILTSGRHTQTPKTSPELRNQFGPEILERDEHVPHKCIFVS
jgi:hypothetical protein